MFVLFCMLIPFNSFLLLLLCGYWGAMWNVGIKKFEIKIKSRKKIRKIFLASNLNYPDASLDSNAAVPKSWCITAIVLSGLSSNVNGIFPVTCDVLFLLTVFSVTGQKCPSQHWLNHPARFNNPGTPFFLLVWSMISPLFFFLPTKWVKLICFQTIGLYVKTERKKEKRFYRSVTRRCNVTNSGKVTNA